MPNGYNEMTEQPTTGGRSLRKLNLGLGLWLFGIVALTAVVMFVSATSVSGRKDTLSNQTKSQTSSHKITFTLSGGNTFAAGDSVIVDFHEDEGMFAVDGASVVVADVAFDDGTARTVYSVTNGAASCAGSVGTDDIAVGIADATGIITLTACPSYSASAAGAAITLSIGQDAGGTNRITNPSAAGSYTIDILDAGGDCSGIGDTCDMGVAVIDSGAVTISAVVSAVCGNTFVEAGETCDDGNVISGDGCSSTCQTEGGGGPPADTTPPIITSGPTVSNITKNSATVSWDTNEASSSIVNYGLTATYGSQVSNPSLVYNHSVALSSLSEATLYHYQVCSADGSNNQVCSGDNTFSTVDQTPPVISNVVVSGITETQATFTWTTDEISDSHVDYQATTAGPPYSGTQADATMVTSHSVTVFGLTTSTTYHYRVRSIDPSTNEGFTTDTTFTTAGPADTTAPVISGITVTSITQDSAIVSWTTDENADSKVDYGTTASYGSTTSDATMVTSHSILLSSLTPGTIYHYRVRSADAALNEAASGDATFTTLPPPDTTPPVITNIQVISITGTSAIVTWTTDEQATRFVDYGTTVSYGSTTGSATPLQTSHSVTLSGLTPMTTYHYRVRSKDAANNEAVSGDKTFITLDTTPPTITNVQVSGITSTGAVITWTTNEASDSKVDYDIDSGTPYANLTTNATMVTSHSVTLSTLTPGTKYYFRVRSSDAASNQGTSTESNFTTLPPADTTPPVITNVQVSGLTANSATITWTTNEQADSKVDYGTTASYGSTKTNATLVTSHSVTVTGLSENTTYHYRVRSADAAANEASSGDATFKTIDTTAPAISNVQVSGITETSVVVTWTTNENATSNVDYDLVVGPPYGLVKSDATPKTSHSITLTGLSPNTLYHFRVRSVDPENNSSASGDSTFTTIDTTAPVISNVQVSGITSNGATITWTTNEGSDSTVEYGTTVSYGSVTSDPASVTSHSITLSGLTPVTQYHFKVKSKDSANNESASSDATFTTTAPPAPVISNIQVTGITQTQVTIKWDTDAPSDSKVDYGLTLAYGSTQADATAVTAHTVTVSSLLMNQTYNFRVRSKDQYNQTSSSANQTFTTLADTTPPGNVSGFTATPGVNSVSLSWTNPTDPDLIKVQIVRKTGGQPTGPTDGTIIYTGLGTSKVDTGLTNGVTYYYGAFAIDNSNNASSGAFANAMPTGPVDVTPPADIIGFTATPGDQQIQLTWTNPLDPDWASVRIRRKTSGFPTNKDDGTLVYDGNGTSKLDTGRTNGTIYYYRAFSYDGALNFTAGVDAFATPVAPIDNTPPGAVTDFVASPGDGQVQLSWVNPTDADYAGTRVLRKTGSFPFSQLDGTVVFEGTSNSKLDSSVTNGTTYYYAAFTFDTHGNWSGAVTASATPEAGAVYVPPACSDTDGGKNYVLQGTVTAGESAYQDICANPLSLVEQYCDAANVAQSETHDCGEGFKCSAGRCTADTMVAVTEICGNGICAGSENSLNCVADCPVESTEEEVAVEAPAVAAMERLGTNDVQFWASGRKVRILPVEGNHLNTFPKMTIQVYLPDASIRKPIKSAFTNFNGAAYPMRPTASYEATILTPDAIGSYTLSVVVEYEDDTSDKVDYSMAVNAFGTVFETVDGNRVPVSDARVTLLRDIGGGNFEVVGTDEYGQLNPQLTNENGAYGYIVPPGIYKLKAEKDGYRTKEKIRFPLLGNLVQVDMELIPLPPEKIETLDDAAAQAQFVAKSAAEDVKEVIQNPIVEETTQTVAAPTVAAVAVANVASAGAATATAIPYMMYLYSFLAQPTLLIARRRRKKWGIVFNAITKIPVDLAIVRLVAADTGRIIRSAVTDKGGRYFFIAPEGKYRMTVSKSGFVFPTEYMKGLKEGPKYSDLYHGEVITAQKGAAIIVNIPLDPTEKEKTPRRVIWGGIARRFQTSIGLLSILGMTVAAIIQPSKVVIGMLVGNILLYFLFRRLALGKRPKNWGVVSDKKSGKPLGNAIVRIFESKYNKLLETQVTGNRGRYAFLVGNNVYYVTYEKPGYRKTQEGPVDLVDIQKEADQVVALDVKLEREGKGEKKGGAEKGKPSLLVGKKEEGAEKEEKKASLLVGPGAAKEKAAVAEGQAKQEPQKPEEKKEIPWELKMLQEQEAAVAKATPAEKPAEKPAEAPAQPTGDAAWEAEMMKAMGGTGEVAATPESEKEADLEATRKEMAEPSEEQMLAESAVKAVEAESSEGVEGAPKESPLPKPETPTAAPEIPEEAEPVQVKAEPVAHTEAPSELERILMEGLEAEAPTVGKPQEEAPKDGSGSPPAAAGTAEAQKLLQDAEHAHPETKLVQDVEHAHPETKLVGPPDEKMIQSAEDAHPDDVTDKNEPGSGMTDGAEEKKDTS